MLCLQDEMLCPKNAVTVLVQQPLYHQELMNRHDEKERWTSVPILCQITLQNAPYMDYKLLMLTSFEVTTVTTMGSQEPACCDKPPAGFLMK